MTVGPLKILRDHSSLPTKTPLLDVEHASGIAGRSPPARNLPQLQFEGFENTPFDDELQEPGDIVVCYDQRMACVNCPHASNTSYRLTQQATTKILYFN